MAHTEMFVVKFDIYLLNLNNVDVLIKKSMALKTLISLKFKYIHVNI